MRIAGSIGRNLVNSRQVLSICALSGLLLTASALAVDVTWTNANSGWDNIYAWDLNIVPGMGDRAIFGETAAGFPVSGYAVGLNISNDVVGDIVFNATSADKGIYWKNATNTLTVINSYVITQAVGAAAINTLRTGTIAVTNGSGTATFEVGDASGKLGLLKLEHQDLAGDTSITNYPVLIADNFLMASNGVLTFAAGTLTTLAGSIDRGTNTELQIGTVAADIATWNILKGTNTVSYTSSGTTRLGYQTGASAKVAVSGSNTLWSVGGTQLNVGNNGSATLHINNGAHVAAKSIRVGGNSTASSNSVIYVDGPGSRLDGNGGFTVGHASSYDQVIVTNGAQIVITNNFVTIGGGGFGSSNNLLQVTGTGSVFRVSDLIQLGNGAATTDTVNRLEILDGAEVYSDSASAASRIGASATDADNSVLVDGSGSIWAVTGVNSMRIGDVGPRSSMTVSRGGHVTVIGSSTQPVYIGNSTSASNNTVTITDTNSLWDTGTLGFYVGNNGFGNTLIISNGGQVLAKATASFPISVGNGAAGSNNAVTVTGPGSQWIVDVPAGSQFRFGSSRNNQLNITNGGHVVVTNGIMTVGYAANPFNSVTVSGSGSVLDVTDLLQIGAANGSKSNSLQITQGGVVRTGSATASTRIGRSVGDDYNSALIDGNGSLWEIDGTNGFLVGNGGNYCTLTVQNGGAMVVPEKYVVVGATGGGVGNAATISSGSINVASNLEVRTGTLTFNGGTITAGNFLAYNGPVSVFAFNSGLLSVNSSTVSNGAPLVVGNGVDAAMLRLGGGTNTFVDGLTISSSATLSGVGTIAGNVTLANSATWTPGSSIGTQTVDGAAVLNPDTVLNYELGAPIGGDLIEVTGNLTLDGTVNVTDLGSLANGEYVLFTYGSLTDNGLNVGTMPGSFTGTVSNDVDGQRILLVVSGGGPTDPFALWQLQYFGSTNCALCGGAADFDGDGISNTNEFLTGTVPTNSASGLRIVSTTRSGNNITVTWSTAGGGTNVVQVTGGTVNGSYTNNFVDLPASQTVIPGSGDSTTNYVDVGGATNTPARYYRIRLVP